MTEPHTTLDRRFSDADATATGWQAAAAALQAAEICWLSSVRGDGRPHVTPLVAVWSEGRMHFSTGETEQKAQNLRANPRVVLTAGGSAWDTGLDVMVEGTARRVRDAPTLTRLAQAWRAKWDGRWEFGVGEDCFLHADGGGPVLVFAIDPERVLAFGRMPFTHTSHRF